MERVKATFKRITYDFRVIGGASTGLGDLMYIIATICTAFESNSKLILSSLWLELASACFWILGGWLMLTEMRGKGSFTAFLLITCGSISLAVSIIFFLLDSYVTFFKWVGIGFFFGGAGVYCAGAIMFLLQALKEKGRDLIEDFPHHLYEYEIATGFLWSVGMIFSILGNVFTLFYDVVANLSVLTILGTICSIIGGTIMLVGSAVFVYYEYVNNRKKIEKKAETSTPQYQQLPLDEELNDIEDEIDESIF